LYSKQIENLIQLQINYITKLEFFPVFKDIFEAVFTEQNIKARFWATGLVLYNPENVLSYLDLRLKIPISLPVEEQSWNSKIPQNIKELESQTAYFKTCIVQYQDSSPSSINKAFDQLVKGAQIIVYSAILLKAEVKALQKANQIKKKRERKKKKYILQSGSLTVEEGKKIVQSTQTQKEDVDRATQAQGLEGQQWHCSLCNQVGHNTRICKQYQDAINIER
jgi:hypothetical protein